MKGIVILIVVLLILLTFVVYKQRNITIIRNMYNIYHTLRGNTEIVPVRINLLKYCGKWHEMVRLPSWFENGLINVTATYTINETGMNVLNEGFDGKQVLACRGVAVPDGEIDSNYNVDGLFWVFFSDFPGEYVVIEVDCNYEYVIVGDRSRKHLWIMTRQDCSEYFNNIYPELYKKLIFKYGYSEETLNELEFRYPETEKLNGKNSTVTVSVHSSTIHADEIKHIIARRAEIEVTQSDGTNHGHEHMRVTRAGMADVNATHSSSIHASQVYGKY